MHDTSEKKGIKNKYFNGVIAKIIYPIDHIQLCKRNSSIEMLPKIKIYLLSKIYCEQLKTFLEFGKISPVIKALIYPNILRENIIYKSIFFKFYFMSCVTSALE